MSLFIHPDYGWAIGETVDPKQKTLWCCSLETADANEELFVYYLFF